MNKEEMTVKDILLDLKEKEDDLFGRFKPLEDKKEAFTEEEQKEWEKLCNEMWNLSAYKRSVTQKIFWMQTDDRFKKKVGT